MLKPPWVLFDAVCVYSTGSEKLNPSGKNAGSEHVCIVLGIASNYIGIFLGTISNSHRPLNL
jgi:hypothetical protein